MNGWECFKGYTVGERTNNRLESINAKVKSVCSKYASLSTFFEQFFFQFYRVYEMRGIILL